VQAHTVADLDRRVSQIDSAIEEAPRRGKTNAALSAMEGQRRARTGLVNERKREAGTLWWPYRPNALQWPLKGWQIETESAPIRYVAAVFCISDQERRQTGG
jgi:hypothetical protein